MLKEINQGYEIIQAESYITDNTGRQARVVLGRKTTSLGVMFVTWESMAYPLEDGGYRYEYFWGHYHAPNDGASAFADYHRRLMKKYMDRER